jgi:hypothetical protein
VYAERTGERVKQTDGMVEYWNIGVMTKSDHPSIPMFQYSIIPTFYWRITPTLH